MCWLLACLALLVSLSSPARAQPCEPDGRCLVAGGHYRLRLPPGWDGQRPLGVVLFFHGFRGSSEETLGIADFVAEMDRTGFALVAMHGERNTWAYPGSPSQHRDDFAYVAAVLDDLPRRFTVDQNRVVAAGFSQGASLVWYLACTMPQRFSAFLPVAGAFWRPQPQACAGPVKLRHVHGTGDPTVPMAGRVLGGGRWRQGDVLESFATLAAAAGCKAEVLPPVPAGDLACQRWQGCSREGGLELCLHADGHDIRARWLAEGLALLVPEPRR